MLSFPKGNSPIQMRSHLSDNIQDLRSVLSLDPPSLHLLFAERSLKDQQRKVVNILRSNFGKQPIRLCHLHESYVSLRAQLLPNHRGLSVPDSLTGCEHHAALARDRSALLYYQICPLNAGGNEPRASNAFGQDPGVPEKILAMRDIW